MYIENINLPKDIKKLSVEQLSVLAEEVRTALIRKLSEHGGHIGPNLGMVETTIALHYVFNSPIDKIVLTYPIRAMFIKCLPEEWLHFLIRLNMMMSPDILIRMKASMISLR